MPDGIIPYPREKKGTRYARAIADFFRAGRATYGAGVEAEERRVGTEYERLLAEKVLGLGRPGVGREGEGAEKAVKARMDKKITSFETQVEGGVKKTKLIEELPAQEVEGEAPPRGEVAGMEEAIGRREPGLLSKIGRAATFPIRAGFPTREEIRAPVERLREVEVPWEATQIGKDTIATLKTLADIEDKPLTDESVKWVADYLSTTRAKMPVEVARELLEKKQFRVLLSSILGIPFKEEAEKRMAAGLRKNLRPQAIQNLKAKGIYVGATEDQIQEEIDRILETMRGAEPEGAPGTEFPEAWGTIER